jgi:hypothetical protein
MVNTYKVIPARQEPCPAESPPGWVPASREYSFKILELPLRLPKTLDIFRYVSLPGYCTHEKGAWQEK